MDEVLVDVAAAIPTAPTAQGSGPEPDDDDPDADRTAGFFGGQESGHRPSTGGKGEDQGTPFTTQLKEFQEAIWKKPHERG
jgi:hypothetical protein